MLNRRFKCMSGTPAYDEVTKSQGYINAQIWKSLSTEHGSGLSPGQHCRCDDKFTSGNKLVIAALGLFW
jgi:hypothetical protein